MTPYEFKRLTCSKSELQQLALLLQTTFSKAKNNFSYQYLNWLYCENPFGYAVGYNAYFENELVGHYATIPIRGYLKGRLTPGLLSLNTATAPKHQGKGLFTALASKTYAEATAEGYEFVVGVANANSTPGFIKKLGFQYVAPLIVKIGIGTFVRTHDSENAQDFDLHLSSDFVSWRTKNPNKNYFRHKNLPYVMATGGTIKVNLSSLPVDEAFLQRGPLLTTPFTAWIGLMSSDIRTNGIFFELPQFAKPSPLNFIFKSLIARDSIELRPDRVNFETIGFDAF